MKLLKNVIMLTLFFSLFFSIIENEKKVLASEKLNVNLLGTYNGGWPYTTRCFDVSLDTVFLGSGRGLLIIDFSNSDNPNLLGTFYCQGTIGGLAKKGKYIYVADSLGYFRVINISAPSNPTEDGSLNTGSHGWWDVAVDGNYAYIDGGGVLRIINISDPANPFEESNIPMNVISLDVLNNYVYVGSSNGLKIVNVSNPSYPIEEGHFDTDGYCWDLTIDGNYLYLIDWNTGLRIVDVSNPSNPTQLGIYKTSSSMRGVDLCNNYAYISGDSLWVLNIADMNNIFLTGYYAGAGFDVKISNNKCYTLSSGSIKKFEYAPPAFSDQNGMAIGIQLDFNENEQGDGHEVNMTFSSATGNGNIVVDQFNSKYPDLPGSDPLNCFWDINLSSNISDFLGDLSFHYLEDDVLGFTESSAFLGIAKYIRPTSTWEWLGGIVDADNNEITVSGISSLSHFVLFCSIFGDITGDGYVDLADFQRMGDVWSQTNSTEFDEGSDARFFNYNKSSGGTQIIDENDLNVFESCWHNGISPGTPGQSSSVGIRIDFNYQISGNQNQNSISPPGTGADIYLEIHITMAPNLDTYEFELNYPGSDLIFENAFEDNSFSGENNFLKKNGGSTMGWNVTDYGDHIYIRNTLAGDHGWDTPDGDGLLALIKFKSKVDAPGGINFGKVEWYDKDRVHNVCNDKDQGALPIELNSFSISVKNNSVYLQWQTQSETNNFGFDIEMSKEQKVWNKIGFVQGHGTSNKQHSYTFIDKNLESDHYYYRLKQIDSDGSYSYSEVLGISILPPNNFSLSQNYPNPFNSTTAINFELPRDEYVKLTLYNMIGKKQKILAQGNYGVGFHKVLLDAKELSSGLYIYKLEAGGFVDVKKLVVLK